jgi:alpha-glucan,water dikinase
MHAAQTIKHASVHARRYAGAGLFDSVQSVEPQAVPVDYTADRLFSDAEFQAQTLARIAAAAAAVEAAAGGTPQDIEGVVTAEGEIFIVQTRPQV